MTNQSICCDSALASPVQAGAETCFWIDFSQGESVAESGSIIRHYFRTHFSLYVVPRGLSLAILCTYHIIILLTFPFSEPTSVKKQFNVYL